MKIFFGTFLIALSAGATELGNNFGVEGMLVIKNSYTLHDGSSHEERMINHMKSMKALSERAEAECKSRLANGSDILEVKHDVISIEGPSFTIGMQAIAVCR